ncbi:hypothetical protein QR78_05585 [Methylobacterium indicum]|uniref:Uncharacterized protein n=2 Tax=Methylobacterium indicum TaxID=1775910 RepID=A0ABR5HGI8_9HYPH|nr:hypothetical protein QR78_05585 [Methylobacterium indicum]KMO25690.1 hypothetical protein QR79_06500 [Methylobacterium indicum]
MPVRPWRAAGARSYFPAPIYRRAAPTLPPDEPVPGEIEEWEAVTAVRPDTAFVRAVRFLNASGDLLSAFALVAGGMHLIGLATHF